jgi:succinate dehydrogenase / fumarate reductase cytochrome b subunit
MEGTNKPPVFLNLLQIRLPVSGVLSIGHRISGVLLFLCIPPLLSIFAESLTSEAGFAAAAERLATPAYRWLAVLVVWMFAHHFFAGIRFLLIDLDLGVDRAVARTSAWVVFGAGVLCMLIAAWYLL